MSFVLSLWGLVLGVSIAVGRGIFVFRPLGVADARQPAAIVATIWFSFAHAAALSLPDTGSG